MITLIFDDYACGVLHISTVILGTIHIHNGYLHVLRELFKMHLEISSLSFTNEAYMCTTVQQGHHSFFLQWLDFPNHCNWNLDLLYILSSQLSRFNGFFQAWHKWFRNGSALILCPLYSHPSSTNTFSFLAATLLKTWHTWQGTHMLASIEIALLVGFDWLGYSLVCLCWYSAWHPTACTPSSQYIHQEQAQWSRFCYISFPSSCACQ